MRQRPCAHARQIAQSRSVEIVDINRTLAIPQLAHVIVARSAILGHKARPTQQHIGRILNQLLPLNHAPTVRGVRRRAAVMLEHGIRGLLHLNHHRIVDITRDPHRRPRALAHRAHAHHLAGRVLIAQMIEHPTAIVVQGMPVALEQRVYTCLQRIQVGVIIQLIDRHQLGRIGGWGEMIFAHSHYHSAVPAWARTMPDMRTGAC